MLNKHNNFDATLMKGGNIDTNQKDWHQSLATTKELKDW